MFILQATVPDSAANSGQGQERNDVEHGKKQVRYQKEAARSQNIFTSNADGLRIYLNQTRFEDC